MKHVGDYKIKSCVCETLNLCTLNGHFFKHVILTFDLTDDLDRGNKEKVLPQRIHLWNMEALYYVPFKSYC